MKTTTVPSLISTVILLAGICGELPAAPPLPLTNLESPLMLAGVWVPEDPQSIAFENLPRVASRHAGISDVRVTNGVNQHNYLTHHNGRFWAMWS
ncbi:MAG: hypothetical protein KA152_18720, partial [Verrucomicrobiales bacterium]|nr:hypothetical protein [Verrucomicrobiales bacterium]